LEPIEDALRNHVRALLRKPTRQRVWTALQHVRANADRGNAVVERLVREMEGVSATWEWEQWRKQDPVGAEEMRWYAHTHAREAWKSRDWLKAVKEAREMIEYERMRKELLAEDPEKAR
jgi:hypothetical protein